VKIRLRFWAVTVSAVLAIALTLSLGLWQLSRAAQKNAIGASILAQSDQTELDNTSLGELTVKTDADGMLYRNASLRGYWLAGQTIFLDNRQMNDKVGFYVVTPLQLEASEKTILVYRGWVMRNFLNRTALPELTTPAGIVTLHGRIAPEPGKLYEPGTPARTTIRQNLDIGTFSAEIKRPLLPVVLMESGSKHDGLDRSWPPINLGVEKHYGYAAQWFGISALIALLYCRFQLFKPYSRRPKDATPHVS
jgi:surfeit locus 1 family protein